MNALKLPAEGGCRCGALRFRITEGPLLTSACHCRGCQRMSASAFSLSAAIPKAGFEVTAGEPVIGGVGKPPMHHFCSRCLTWAYTVPPWMDGFVNIRATLLDDASWFSPFVETQTAEKLAWATTPAKHSFERWPADDAWPQLIAEYQKEAGRTSDA